MIALSSLVLLRTEQRADCELCQLSRNVLISIVGIESDFEKSALPLLV